jgi:hypothetical protein
MPTQSFIGGIDLDDDRNVVLNFVAGVGNYFQLFNAAGVASSAIVRIDDGSAAVESRDVAMNDDGTFIVTWGLNSTSTANASIWIQQYDAAGAALSSAVELGTSSVNASMTSIKMSSSGDFAVSWLGDSRRYLQRYDGNLTPIGTTFDFGNVQNPSFAINSMGDFAYGYGNVNLRYFESSTETFSDPYRIDRPNLVRDGSANDPYYAAALDPSGGLVTAFIAKESGTFLGNQVYLQRFDAVGAPLGKPQKISLGSETRNVSLAMAPDGSFVVVWVDWFQARMRGQRFDITGNAIGSIFSFGNSVGVSAMNSSSLAMDAAGNFIFAWTATEYNNAVIYQVFDANGAAVGETSFLTVSAGNSQITGVNLSANAASQFVFSWQQYDSSNGHHAFATRYDFETGLFDAIFQVSQTSIAGTQTGQVFRTANGIAADGSFVIAWANGTSTDDYDIYARRFATDGTPLGAEFIVNSDRALEQNRPVIVMQPNGEWLIGWQSRVPFPNNQFDKVRIAHFSGDGSKLGDDASVGNIQQGRVQFPDLAINAAGTIVAAWGTTQNSPEVYAQRFMLNYAPETPIVTPIAAISEGDSLVLSTTAVTDPEGEDVTYAWDINGDGLFEDAMGLSVSLNWSQLAALGLDGRLAPYSVRVAAIDPHGNRALSAAASLSITNAAPVASLTIPNLGLRTDGGAGHAVRGQDAVFVFTATDLSAADAAAGYSFAIDWNGDGQVDETIVGPSGMTVRYVFAATGVYNIGITATDKDGGQSNLIQQTVTITDWDKQIDASDSAKTNLVWGGTTGGDAFAFVGNYVLTQLLNNQFFIQPQVTFVGSFNGKLQSYGQAGNDLFFADILSLPLEFFGGDGNDVLVGGRAGDTLDGGAGDDILFGGTLSTDGDDWLSGGAGDDIVIGHLGADTLFGGSGQDLLVAGSLYFGIDLPIAIYSIQSEWLSARPLQTRAENILGMGTGPRNNGNYYLTPGSTLLDDDAVDVILGEDEDDWLLYDFGEDLAADVSPSDLATGIG